MSEEIASCAEKATYKTWAIAEKSAKYSRRQKSTRMRPYRCKFCHGWHVGTPKPKFRPQR